MAPVGAAGNLASCAHGTAIVPARLKRCCAGKPEAPLIEDRRGEQSKGVGERAWRHEHEAGT